MRRRSEPMPAPEPAEYPWFTVEVEGRGLHHFRALSPIKVVRFGKEIGAASGPISADDKLGLAEDNLRQFGAGIGLCWAHPELELESQRGDFGSLLDYGEAVSEELHEAGYTLAQQTAMALRVMASLPGVQTTRQEVQERAGFSEAQKDGPTS